MQNKEKFDQNYLSDNQTNIVEFEDLKEKLQTEIKKRKELEYQLKERKKELHCHNEISRIFTNTLLSVDDKIEKIMLAIQHAMQFPEITEVCFTINGKSIKTRNYSHSKYNLVHNLFEGEKSYGEIKVCYLEDSFQGDVNHVFLNEEYELIFSVGVRIINYLISLEEKQKAEKSLQFCNSFMAASPDALIITNLKAIIEYISPATLKLFGYNRNDDLIGKNILDLIDESDQGFAIYEIEKMFEGIFSGCYDYRAVKGDGTLGWIGVNGDFIRNSEGQNEKIVFVVRDIENRKKAELELQKSEEMYRNLIESSDASIMMLNQAGEYLFLNLKEAQRFGLKPEDFKGKRISDFFSAEEVTQMLDDIQRVLCKNKGFSKEIAVHFKGVDSFYRINIQPVRNVYRIPVAALFYITDITQFKQGEEKIRISEERFRNIVESINEVLFTIDINGTIKYISPTVSKLFGYTAEEIVGRSEFELMHPDDIPRVLTALKNVETNIFSYLDIRYIVKDGQIKWVRSTFSPIYKDGKLTGGNGILTDITQQKLAEEKLSKSEERFRNLVETISEVIYEIDVNGIFNYVSPSVTKIAGFSPDELIGKDFREFVYKDDIQIITDAIINLPVSEEGLISEFRMPFKDGRLKWCRASVIRKFSNGQFVGGFGSVIDISATREYSEELKIKDFQHREAQRQAKLGHWYFDIANNYLYCSDEMYRIFGIEPANFAATYEAFIHYIHPDDKDRVTETYQTSLSDKKPYEIIYKLLTKNGDIKYINEKCISEFDENDNPLKSLGTIMDITKQVILEQNLREKEERFEQIAEQSNTVIWEIDNTGMYTYVNRIAEKVWGYKPEELVGRMYYYDLHPQENREEFIESTMKFFAGKQQFVDLHNQVVRKDGQVIVVATNGIPVLDKNGGLLGYRGADDDITEKLKAEEELRMFKKASDAASYGITINKPDGEVIYANETWAEMHGCGIDEIIGKHMSVGHNENQMGEVRTLAEKLLTEGKLVSVELDHLRKDGTVFPTLMNATVITDIENRPQYISATIIDIDELKKAQQKLKEFYLDLEIKVNERTKELAEKTTELENFFNVSLDLLCIADTDGNFLKLNKAWEDILGYKMSELENHRFLDFVHPMDMEATREIMRGLENQEMVLNFVNRYRTSNNSYKYIEWHSVPVGTKIYAAARDITESKIITDFQQELLQISSKLTGIPFAEIKPSIIMALEKIGKFLFADRAYIFEFSSDQMTMTNTYEWCNEGINAEIENLQDLPVGIFPEWMKKLQKNEEISIPSVKDLPDDWAEEKAALQPQGIQSLLAIPLYSEKVLIGFAGLDFVSMQKEFNSFEVNIVKLWGAMLTGLINNFRIENLLEQSRQNMITFFNTVDDFLFVIDENGSIIYVNETVNKRLGYSVEELIGQPVITMHPENRRQEALQIIGEMMEEKADYCPVPLITTQGLEIQVETRVKKGIWNGKSAIFGVTKDISQIKLSEQKFASAFHSNSAIMTITRFTDSQFVDVNKAFTNTLGYSRNEIIGETLVTLGVIREKEAEHFIQTAINSGIPVREIEVNAYSKSGDLHILLLSAEEIFVGMERCILSVAVDITDRKKMEKELIHARNEAQKANKAKSEFLSRMSHELRTPMNSILGFAQLLEMGELNASQTRGINHILKSGKYLLNMINEVLELSRIESGKLSLSIENIHLVVLIDEILDFIHPQAKSKKIEIEKADINSDIVVKADKQKLKQVLINLLINSVKYNREFGRIDLKTEIKNDGSQNEKRLRIMVTDTGIGISAENQKKLFSPFERIGADKTGIEGTGLGLTVSKKLIEAMNGNIGFESKINEGSTFWVELPIVKKTNKQIGKAAVEKNDIIMKSSISGTVLYIEDNESNIDLMDQIMNQNRPGVTMIVEKNGSNAIVSALVNNPDLILLDINLPGIQGNEVLSLIMENDLLKNIPVVIVSADATPLKIKSMLKLGAHSYLTKPFNIHQLLQSIDQHLEKLHN